MTASITYARQVALVACPFCREMFQDGEHAACPVCGVKLTSFEKLPPSAEAVDVDDLGIPVEPQHEPLKKTDMGRGKGAIALLAAAGMALFFLPWVHMTMPQVVTYTGFELARRLGWAWAAPCAWTVLVPTVLSRQSIAQLRGARVIAAFLAAVPGVTSSILMARPPHSEMVAVHVSWIWPMYATVAVSVAAAIVAVRLGGSLEDVAVARGSSEGQTLH
jgi:hypothetical protein